jgi:hypothetical protein
MTTGQGTARRCAWWGRLLLRALDNWGTGCEVTTGAELDAVSDARVLTDDHAPHHPCPGNRVRLRFEHSRSLVSIMPGARLVALESDNHIVLGE